MLKALDYGRHADCLDCGIIATFFYELPDYEIRLRDYSGQGNRAITDKLDELLADNCHLGQQYHVTQ